MDELLDILTSEGKPTGKTALKSVAHQKGLFHATVHIWFFTADKKILLQKRALTKKVFPGIWDISVAGHISAGEGILKGATREISEEIGLEIQEHELLKIGTRKHEVLHENGIQDHEFHHVFIAELKVPISALTMQTEEVAGLELWDLNVLKQTKNLENVLLPRFHEYYCTVYDKISTELSIKGRSRTD